MADERDAARRAHVDAVLAEALDVDAGNRAAFLADACAGDEALRAELEELLRWSEEESAALDSGALASGGLGRALAAELAGGGGAPDAVGRRIGPWRLEREIGRGGMGTVYLATRADGEFAQTAALKLLHAGGDPEEVIRRFELERQILASLHHPDIAAVLGGGRTEEGRPYFVMEYVEGRPIDRYCDEEGLTIDRRLDLFARVARAVEHAHANLIVHRDLKPANIVVTGDGRVKLLDFGIAKILDPLMAPQQPVTRTAARVLTPEYASPEQVLGRPITTASDLYQLGLLLYELLTGSRAQQVTGATPAELERAVCERPPTRPSTVVRTAGDEAPARARGTTREGLARRLRGDLDVIVLRALDKDPERRYPGVAALLDDLDRHRRGLPVRARPDTLGYRARKFARRHWLGVATAAGVALLLAGLGLFHASRLTRERDRARLEAEKSGAMLSFLLETFTSADPIQGSGAAPDLPTLLERGASRARRELAGQPEVEATVLDSIGRILLNLGRGETAAPLLEEAWELRRTILPSGSPDLARSLVGLAALHQSRAEYDEAERLARNAVERLRREPGEPDLLPLALERLADVNTDLGRYEESLTLYDEALALREAIPGDDLARLRTLYMAATVHFDLGDFPRAAEAYRAAAEACRAYGGAEASPLPWALGGLGASQAMIGELEAAEATLREAVGLLRERLGPTHPDLADYERNLATTLGRLGGHEDEAEALYADCIAIYTAAFGENHPEVAKTLYDLAQLERHGGRFAEARRDIDRTLAILGALLPPDHPHLGRATAGLAWIELDGGEPGRAVASFRRALEILDAGLPPEHELVVQTRLGLGRALIGAGDATAGCGQLRSLEPLLATEATERYRGEVDEALASCPAGGAPAG